MNSLYFVFKSFLDMRLCRLLFFVLSYLPGYGYAVPPAQQPLFDSLVVRHYSYGEYKAGSGNYCGVAAPDGMLYFGNSEGVLSYDGLEWKLYKVADQYGVTALLLKDNKLYYGGYNVAGYITFDPRGNAIIHPFKFFGRLQEKPGDIWQIIETKDGLYFQSYKDIYLLKPSGKFYQIGVPNAHIFKIQDFILASDFTGRLWRIKDRQATPWLALPDIYDDAVYAVVPLTANRDLLFTDMYGVFVLDHTTQTIKPWQVPVNAELAKYDVYHAMPYLDSLIICTTETNGLYVFNKKGQKKKIPVSQLPKLGMREIVLDHHRQIWITSGDGIYHIYEHKYTLLENFKPAVKIKSISSELGPITQINRIFEPNYLVIEFATPGFEQAELEYSVWLEGYDDDWTPWEQTNRKEYTSLGHGDYIFHVKARTRDGRYAIAPASLAFGVTLPLYKRPAVIALILLLMGLLAFMLLRLRYLELKKAHADLEVKVNERTAQLRDEREKLKALNEELSTANAELDNFVYRSSHDLMAPLKSLRGLMNVTRLETDDKTINKYIDMMEASVLRLERFINHIMEYSINAKSDSIHTTTDLEVVLNEILEELSHFDKRHAISISLDLQQKELNTDPKRLKIILSNLLTNAIKYHNTEQANPAIKVTSYKKGHEVHISVQDNGHGIAPEHLQKIFDMFYRASETSEGSGLGLYIVQDTAKKLGGRIEVASQPGQGSTFTLILPE